MRTGLDPEEFSAAPEGAPCWFPKAWMTAAAATPETDRAKFELNVLTHHVRHLASSSFAGFRAALRDALPQGDGETWLEPDPDSDGEGGTPLAGDGGGEHVACQ